MKKSLLAVAVAAALPALAQAQSNVTMYGILDANVEYFNVDAVSATDPAASSQFQVNQGRQSGSRLGFRGVEDIGGGLKGIFTIEHRLSPDTGTQTAAPFWHGQSWVGLEAGWGRLTLGRQYSPLFWAMLPADFSGYGFYNNWLGGFITSGLPAAVNTAIGGSLQGPFRLPNSIAYRSPTMGGFTAYGTYVAGETVADTGNIWGLAATWQMGGLYLAGGHHAVQDATPGTLKDVSGLAASYKTAGWGVSLGAYQTGLEASPGEVNTLMLSAFLSLGGGTLVGNVLNVETDGFPAATALNVKNNHFGLAYHRPISKRTNWYAAYGQADMDADPARVASGRDSPTQFAIGVRHLF
jgi:predicted porin